MSNILNTIDRVSKLYVRKTRGCWYWQGYLQADGYGHVKYHGRMLLAHRLFYQELVGPIKAGLEVDHLCRNRACVNPTHLEPVTHQENMARGSEAIKTHCKHGHAFTMENTRLYVRANGRRNRICLQCENIRSKIRWTKQTKEK